MAEVGAREIWALADAIRAKDAGGESGYTTGTITRVDADGGAWVHLAGGVDETPVSGSSAALEPGDTVSVRVANGRATVTGNMSAPAASVGYVDEVGDTADRAVSDAARAYAAAGAAQMSADAAADAAVSAQGSASDAAAAAAQASSSADAAAVAANEAIADAENARDAAVSAAATASTAQTSADEAQASAEEARSSASTALAQAAYAQDFVANLGVSVDELKTHVLLTDNGLYIGDESECRMRLTGDRLELIGPDGNPVAYIYADDKGESLFYVERAIIVKDLRFSNWQWKSRDNDNLCLKWVGDDATGGE